MSGNLGETKLRKRQRTSDPMREFDRMPKKLRDWLNTAVLPWRPSSVRRAYEKALLRTGDPTLALQNLEELQQKRLSEDRKIYPPTSDQ